MNNVHLRISVISVPGSLSALKLRGWLQQQAQEIQDASGEQAYVQIKLFLTKRQRFSLPPDKFDKMLNSIVDGFSAIHSIELVIGEQELTSGQMLAEAAKANVELNEMVELLDEKLGKDKGPTVH
jgi:hypothetical protein